MSSGFFQDFLNQLASIYGLASLKPDAMGACQILLKQENLSLLFEYDEHVVPGTILLSLPLGEIPIEEALLTACLQHNQKSENILSLQPDQPICFLHKRFSPIIEREPLQKSLTSFTETAQQWSQQIHHPQTTLPQEDTSLFFQYKKV